METKNTIFVAIATLFILSALIVGCSSQQTPETVANDGKPGIVDNQDRGDPETVLAAEVADGKLVEVYDEYVRIAPGQRVRNWMIINNVLDHDETFTITPCSGCDMDDQVVDIPSGEYKIIKFKVLAMEGQKDISVKDSYNNAYGFARISVIVE